VIHDAQAGDPPAQLAAEKDIRGAREIIGEREVLVDDLDAGVARILGSLASCLSNWPDRASSARWLASAARAASVIARASAGHARSVAGVIAFHDVPGTAELVQLAVLTTTTRRDSEH
jgi:hypothetical protein